MTGDQQTIPYQLIDEAMGRLGAEASAAESHGILCGLLSVSAEVERGTWLAAVLRGDINAGPVSGVSQNATLTAEQAEALAGLYQETTEAVADEALSLYPLLPPDDAPLQERAFALGQWCEGYLFGLGAASMPEEGKLPQEAREALRDVTEISKIGVQAQEQTEEEEDAYMEVVEYVRMAVLLIREECLTLQQSESQQATKH